MRSGPILLALLAALLGASPALACRLLYPDLKGEQFDAVAVVSVRQARARDDERFRYYIIEAATVDVVAGNPGRRTYSFVNGWGSTGCPPHAAPRRGERWVVFLNRTDGLWVVARSFDLRDAAIADPRVAAWVSKHPR